MIRRYRLKSCENLRDIGGFAGEGDIVTGRRQYFRSDDISLCPEEDKKKLRDLGLKVVIDLRGKIELKNSPNTFKDEDGISYFNIPLIPDMDVNDPAANEGINLKELYVGIIENKEAVKKLFKTFAANTEGLTIYHCTAGKDRTGVVTCLLLMLMGVDKYDIAADYQASYTYLMTKTIMLLEEYPNMPQHVLKTEPEWMLCLYDYIVDNYGGVYKYLQSIGISEEELAKIRTKFSAKERGLSSYV